MLPSAALKFMYDAVAGNSFPYCIGFLPLLCIKIHIDVNFIEFC